MKLHLYHHKYPSEKETKKVVEETPLLQWRRSTERVCSEPQSMKPDGNNSHQNTFSQATPSTRSHCPDPSSESPNLARNLPRVSGTLSPPRGLTVNKMRSL